ncbi:MAG: TMEM175 family protein [Dehalococcoidia bacterium]
MTTSRLEAFSDGVFAIAITLLILEIRIPESEAGGHLANDLLHLWPSYAAYAVSFLVIGIYWVNHHMIFDHVERVDRPLLFLNLGLLLSVSFMPFPTGVLARFIREDDAEIAAAAYSATMLVAALAFFALWWYAATREALLQHDVHAGQVRSLLMTSVPGPVLYAACFGLSFINAPLTLAVHAALAIFWAAKGVRWPAHEAAPGT